MTSRVAASLLTGVGLEELIVNNWKEYEDLAVRLALDKSYYQQVKTKLLNNRLTHPTFDTPLYVKNLERGLKAMWDKYRAGQNPEDIYL
jgi:protein O-GlcNAc transferase